MTTEELLKTLLREKPSTKIKRLEYDVFKLIPELRICKGFEQHSKWHIYDVYNHILNVVDNVPAELDLRLGALFHDIGKPSSFILDKEGNGHFPMQWVASSQIFEKWAKLNNIDKEIIDKINKLIVYHNLNVEQLSEQDLNKFLDKFTKEEVEKLFILKRADLLAQNEKCHYLINKLDMEEKMLLDMYKGSEKNENTVLTRSKKKN